MLLHTNGPPTAITLNDGLLMAFTNYQLTDTSDYGPGIRTSKVFDKLECIASL